MHDDMGSGGSPGGSSPGSRNVKVPTKVRQWGKWLLVVAIAVALFFLLRPGTKTTAPAKLSFSIFVNDVTANQVSSATISAAGAVTGTLHSGGSYTSQIPTALNDGNLSSLLLSHKVKVTGTVPSSSSLASLLDFALPLVLIGGLVV